MLKRTLCFLLIAVFWGVMATAQAQQFIYKWTDEYGQLKYSELPPPAGTPYETVRRPAGAAGGAEAAARDLAREQEELAQTLAEEEARRQAQEEQVQQQAEEVRARNCEIARKNVEILQSDRPVIKTDEQGTRVAIDAEQRAAELQRALKDQEYFCEP
jgi:hypothetical protein